MEKKRGFRVCGWLFALLLAGFLLPLPVLAAETATRAPLPDLTVSVSGPYEAQLGGWIELKVTVKNTGDAAAPGTVNPDGSINPDGYFVDLVLSEDQNFPYTLAVQPVYTGKTVDDFVEDMLLLGGRISRTSSIPPGGEAPYTVKVLIPAKANPFTMFIGAVVDPVKRVAESNEENNISFYHEIILRCAQGCECLTEAEAKAKFGQYAKCTEKACGSEQAVGAAALVPKYCFKPAAPKCPAGCVCLTEEDAKKYGYERCPDQQKPCGYDQQQRPLYCYREPASTKCPAGCECLTAEQAKALGYDRFCRNEQVRCGRDESGVPKYCYAVPTGTCPAGCTCLSKEEGYKKGLAFCRDEKGNPVRCGVISEVYGEYKYCFQTGGECRYDYEKNACVGPCSKGQVCQLNTIYRDPETGKVTYAECHCKALPKEGAFRIGQRSYTVDGQVKDMDVAPFIKDGRTQVPVRYLAYALGMSDQEIAWDPGTRRVTLTRGAVKVELLIGRPVIIVNGEEQPIDVAPLIEQGRTFLPARFVAEAFGFNVAWDEQSRAVMISSDGVNSPPTAPEPYNPS